MDFQLLRETVTTWVSSEYSKEIKSLREACESKIQVFERVLKTHPDPEGLGSFALRSHVSQCKSFLTYLNNLP
jgi:hypothetical protein